MAVKCQAMAANRQSPSVQQKEAEARAAKRQLDTNRERGKEAKTCCIKETVMH